jgi:SP family facilitated glucose transporter-like MFS transporter 3
MEKLPDTMRANADGTLTIFTSAEMGRTELYTEIPFTAIHGMQTRERETCDVFEAYTEQLDICQKGGGFSEDEKSLGGKAASSFTEEIAKTRITKPLVIATIAAAASQFLVGYNIVLLNTTEKYVFPGHSTVAWSAAVAALALGCPIGAYFGGTLSDRHGRRMTLILGAMGFLIGGLVQTFAPDLLILTLARFVIGLSSGVATVLVPIYLGELAPPNLRGTLGTVNQFALVVGMLVTDLLSFPLATADGWRELFSVTVFVAVGQLLIAPFVVESPRWLLQRDPTDHNARKILKELRGCTEDHEVEKELATYIIAAGAQRQEHKSQRAVLSEMMSHERVRRLFFSSVCLHMAQQLCGIHAVFYYSTAFFEGVIENPLVGTTFVGAVNVVFTYVALLLMDSCRRKSLLLWSFGGMFFSCIAVIMSQADVFSNSVALIAVNVYVAFYEIGLGPIPFLIVAEMFEPKYVAVTMSLCSQLNWIANFVVGLAFPTMSAVLGKYTFVPFAVVLVLSFFFTWKVFPETHGKSPEEMVADTVQNNSEAASEAYNERGPGAMYIEWQEQLRRDRLLALSTRLV